MRFDEPDVRDSYRRGAHDLYESVVAGLKPNHARAIKAWLEGLDAWEEGEPPHPPLG